MTGGDDILYLITLRNLEIHLVIGLCCFEVCFGTGLLTGLQWGLNCPGNQSRIWWTTVAMSQQCATGIKTCDRGKPFRMFQHLGAGLKVVTNLPKNITYFHFEFHHISILSSEIF